MNRLGESLLTSESQLIGLDQIFCQESLLEACVLPEAPPESLFAIYGCPDAEEVSDDVTAQ